MPRYSLNRIIARKYTSKKSHQAELTRGSWLWAFTLTWPMKRAVSCRCAPSGRFCRIWCIYSFGRTTTRCRKCIHDYIQFFRFESSVNYDCTGRPAKIDRCSGSSNYRTWPCIGITTSICNSSGRTISWTWQYNPKLLELLRAEQEKRALEERVKRAEEAEREDREDTWQRKFEAFKDERIVLTALMDR